MSRNALQLAKTDNVATAMEDIAKGDDVAIADTDGLEEDHITARDDIPRGHKMALRTIHIGDEVGKYGYAIGIVTREIQRGVHVHTDNLSSARGRGDL